MWGKEEIGVLCKDVKCCLIICSNNCNYYYFFWQANTNVVVAKLQASLSLF